LESQSYGLLLFTCNRGEESMRQFTAQVSAKSFDGLIVVVPEGTVDRITDLHRQGLPVVMIDDRGQRTQFAAVSTTNHDGAAAAARHLIGLGRLAPLVISGLGHFTCTRDRLSGFADTYVEAGHPIEPRLVVRGDFTLDSGRAAVKHALAAGVDFDAIFAHNDISAIGAMQAVREAGLRVPDDVAIIGFDDIPSATHTDPPLTTVRQPRRYMGAAAARLLLDQLGAASTPDQSQVIPTELVVRGSTLAA
jgi:LacI family transcriptional regulator